jgi:protein involved in polysaccharide export with SLBB domain
MKVWIACLMGIAVLSIASGQVAKESASDLAAREPRAFVLGMVEKPGIAQRVTKELTLLRAIDAAGGTKSGKIAVVIRHGRQVEMDIVGLRSKQSSDFPLKPWDVVFIKASHDGKIERAHAAVPSSVAAVGDLLSPQLVPFVRKLTALEALMNAGGWMDYGDADLVFVIRNSTVMSLDMRELQRDPSKNPELQPWDIVWHPSGPDFWEGVRP